MLDDEPVAISSRLLSPSAWTGLLRALPSLLRAIERFNRRDYPSALRSFDVVVANISKPDPTYAAFHAYLLLVNGSPDAMSAWGKVVLLAEADDSKSARHASAVARYFIARHENSPAAYQHWREAQELRPAHGVGALIRLSDVALVTHG